MWEGIGFLCFALWTGENDSVDVWVLKLFIRAAFDFCLLARVKCFFFSRIVDFGNGSWKRLRYEIFREIYIYFER